MKTPSVRVRRNPAPVPAAPAPAPAPVEEERLPVEDIPSFTEAEPTLVETIKKKVRKTKESE